MSPTKALSRAKSVLSASLKTMLQSVPAMCKGELFLRTTELLECMGSPVPTQGPFSPTQLRERIAKMASRFGGCTQQDAHEFFLEWIRQLHDEMLEASQQWSREDYVGVLCCFRAPGSHHFCYDAFCDSGILMDCCC